MGTRTSTTGLKVSRHAKPNFGPMHRVESLHVDRALEVGSTSSAPRTSMGTKGEGITEQIVGRWFAQGGGRRERRARDQGLRPMGDGRTTAASPHTTSARHAMSRCVA
jgi:hypothetical protein